MYAWYFPVGTSEGMFEGWSTPQLGKYDVWLNDPAAATPNIGISTGTYDSKYHSEAVPGLALDGTSPQFAYFDDGAVGGYHSVDLTDRNCEFQNLIQWDQLTDAARSALETSETSARRPGFLQRCQFQQNLKQG